MLVAVGLVIALTTYAGVALVRRWALHHRVLDIPTDRSSHERPTPRGGGLAIVAVSLVALVAAGPGQSGTGGGLYWLALGAALVASVSLVDDLRSLPVQVRLVAHIAGALVAVSWLGALPAIGLPSGRALLLGSLGIPLTILWVVGLTNAYNFMDGIDGLAGAQAVIAGLGWFLLAEGDPMVRVIGLVVAASSLGFLLHNWPPARIFMGDVGSAFLGYILAVMTIVASQKEPRFAVVGFLLVWPFVFDTTFTFLRRLLRHENVLAAHRSHLYQRLVIAGFSHQFVMLFYAALAALGVGLARIWLSQMHLAGAIVFASLLAAGASLWGFVEWAERTPRLT